MKVILKRRIEGSFTIKEDYDVMNIIGYFLTDDISGGRGSAKKYFKDWALSETKDSFGGNATNLFKEDGNIILCSSWADDDDLSEIELTNDQFIYLLDRWEELYNKKPSRIVVALENGKLLVEGED